MDMKQKRIHPPFGLKSKNSNFETTKNEYKIELM